MTSARYDIFANLRRSLGVTGTERIRAAEVEERLSEAPLGVIPARGQLDAAGRLALFKAMAEAASATVTEVESPQEVPQAVAAYLRDHNLPATLRMGDDPRLAAMPWRDTSLELASGRSDGHDLNAISHAFGAVTETGTLVMTSGADNPTTLNVLPDNHIVVLSAADVGGDLESVWPKLREALGKGAMPRALNMVTGPSRSADIEQTLFLGAHGPRNLHIVLVKEAASAG
jgi:L-lactate dehydrogenase complex protein LldG